MKLKIRLTKKSLANHFKYYVWIYAAMMVLATSLFSTTITIANNKSPADKQLHTFVCGEAIALDFFQAFYMEMENAFPEMKVVSCENLAFSSTSLMAGQYKDKFLSLIYSKVGDVYIIPYNEFADLAQNGLFEPIEDLFPEYLEDVDPISLKTVTMTLKNENDENETHVYGIPLSHLEFFPYYYNSADKVMVMTSFSQNKENAKILVEWYLDYMIETDWYGTKN